ncbi:NAD(P)-binding domain-containing protein [Nocardiopsis sp. CT-R113]|uniref:NAD(P)-binding domain-containing protein n=1 Tax=Nocardiopsis codii TaxID=3065942 RepID=A0ABU7KCU4_9ACTN|nr:NAD(P)-binding domain-containing protein [Nocardiopsis sp. CT-R113]MEE2039847.1 NAD(P)-binding domain-containing protein [Nocardiopsis sp. CT-R113]
MGSTTGDTGTRTAVTVIGLGEMGTALAGAFVEAGHPTTVWNRSREKAAPLVEKGARPAADVREAVAAGPLVVVSVKGNHTAREVLGAAGDALAGRSVVNLTDGTSAEARETAAWVRERGAGYLHGQIMTIAPAVGSPDAVVFYGGDEAVYDRHREELRLVGGRGSRIADDAGLPTLYGMAVHGTMWGVLNGFLHAAALLTDAGVDVTRFLEQAGPSVSAVTSILPSIADEVDRGAYALEFGALQHHLPSVEDLVRESRDRGIDASFPGYTLDLVARAVADGHADDSYSRLVEHFRGR